jgi:choline dehydrogenase-like flavoprotein
MLAGIGPRDVLEDPRINIPVQVELPGVGRNLQDRYEVSVVNRMKHDWQILAGAAFEKGDPQYQEWSAFHTGVYATNGGLFVVIKKSAQAPKLPDLFCLGLLARFEGYFPKYSKLIAKHHNYLSWVVLKAHTGNTAGTVTLRSADPRDTPLVTFHYFNEGSDDWLKDLDAVVDGIQFVREMTAGVGEYVEEEELPGKKIAAEMSCGSSSRTTPGVTTPHAAVPSDRGKKTESSTASFAFTAPRGCASSTPRSFLKFRAFSSCRRST